MTLVIGYGEIPLGWEDGVLQEQVVHLEANGQHDVDTEGRAESWTRPVVNRSLDFEPGHEDSRPNPPCSLAYSDQSESRSCAQFHRELAAVEPVLLSLE